ncbi:hypothetical protein NK983_35730, partial [Salmonella enterica subsp. enterica serovar Typhimurium]|nr:hypothetical protein [Salmonella enterica subsp. enterica serovar Typhimurium]
ADDVAPDAGSVALRPVSMLRTALTAAAAALVLLLPPLYAAQLAQRELPASPQLALPAELGDGWALDAGPALTDWRP